MRHILGRRSGTEAGGLDERATEVAASSRPDKRVTRSSRPADTDASGIGSRSRQTGGAASSGNTSGGLLQQAADELRAAVEASRQLADAMEESVTSQRFDDLVTSALGEHGQTRIDEVKAATDSFIQHLARRAEEFQKELEDGISELDRLQRGS
jgi:hypothetical protein